MTRDALIDQAVRMEADIRQLPDFTTSDRKAAHSASQIVAALEEAKAKLNVILMGKPPANE